MVAIVQSSRHRNVECPYAICLFHRSPTIQADVVKIFYDPNEGRYVTQDAFVGSRRRNGAGGGGGRCSFSGGLCLDVERRPGSRDNVDYMGSLKNLGLSVIDFKRSFVPSDQHDAPISLDGPTQVIVAIGSLRPSLRGRQTSSSSPSGYGYGSSNSGSSRRGGGSGNSDAHNMEMENTTIDFSSADRVENTCPDVNNREKFDDPPETERWETKKISATQLFNARLGPTGGAKGYEAIVGDSPDERSVVWWINGQLLPEIWVERGKTYAFRVQVIKFIIEGRTTEYCT